MLTLSIIHHSTARTLHSPPIELTEVVKLRLALAGDTPLWRHLHSHAGTAAIYIGCVFSLRTYLPRYLVYLLEIKTVIPKVYVSSIFKQQHFSTFFICLFIVFLMNFCLDSLVIKTVSPCAHFQGTNKNICVQNILLFILVT